MYIQDQIDLSKMEVQVGGRVDNFDITVVDVGLSSQSRDDNEISPRGGIIFKAEKICLCIGVIAKVFFQGGEQYRNLMPMLKLDQM